MRKHALICAEVEFEKALKLSDSTLFDRPKLNQYSALSELASVPHFLLMCVCVCL